MNESLRLLDQIIEKVELEDLEYKQKMIKEHKASKSIGESWTLFHLKQLKSLMEEEFRG
jgi:hypothetical protein